MTFKDNFSKQADLYAMHRPVYPHSLFAFLNSLTASHELAWDCGTGNGQCAVELGNFYDNVVATDASEKQIQYSLPGKNIIYKVERAEHSSLASGSVDLITIAQALHWLDIAQFFEEAKRVMKDGAVIAVISYVNPVVSKEIDVITDHLHDEVLQGFWQSENQLVMEEYRSIKFPFETMHAPEFKIERKLSSSDFLGHLRTWSAVQRYIDKHHSNPILEIEKQLGRHWEKGETKTVFWKLNLKVGRKVQK
jgi:SAM-dependent methyltransferase